MTPNSQDTEPRERDGALARLASDPVSRRRFVAIGGGGTAAALSLALAACGDDDSTTTSSSDGMTTSADTDPLAQFGEGDLGIVNYALTLEYLEAAFYDQVAKSGLFKGGDLELIKSVGADEEAHVKALESTAKSLGTPAPKPKTEFPLDDAASVVSNCVFG